MRSGGIMGLWEFAKEKFSDLKETIIDAIKEMLITKVIEAGIKWLLSLLIPGAGFIKAIMAIKDIVVFFVETAIMLIPAITEAILALASGSVAGVAKAFEFGLSKLIVLVIGLFAKLIGLGDLAKRVQKIFKKIRKRVDKVVRDLFKKAKRAGRKLMRKLGIGKKKSKKGEKPENDRRSDKEKKADLHKGVIEGTAFIKKGGYSKKEIDKKLEQIESKYDLQELKLVIVKNNPRGEDTVHVTGKVNPTETGENIRIELNEADFDPELIKWNKKCQNTIDATDKILTKHEEFEGRNDLMQRQKSVNDKWEENKGEAKKIGTDKELERLVIDEFKEISKESDDLLKDLRKAAPKHEKEKSSQFLIEMQPYRSDVWTKGPHVDFWFTDNPDMKATEAQLEPEGNGRDWKPFGRMGRTSKKDFKQALGIINKLHSNASIMAQAKAQVRDVLANVNETLKDQSISKQLRSQAERAKINFERMLNNM
jgi:3-methyladenine DNA glycosylase Tag